MKGMGLKILLLAIVTLSAFAANSLLCRMALKDLHIDPISFSSLRLISGALVLLIYMQVKRGVRNIEWNSISAGCLMVYVFAFSAAYVFMEAATGALLLFGSVQIAMTVWGQWRGERMTMRKAAGMLTALAGFCLLLLPGAKSPPLLPALLMILSGLAWAAYSLRGRQAHDPSAATAGNFILCVPVVLIIALLMRHSIEADATGILLALLSGGLTSGAAYVLWYALLPYFSAATASTLQLLVPCIALAGGVILIGESPDSRMLLATVTILVGIALVIRADRQRTERR
ncbi:DMT family transporter [Pantoea sp. LMR881]|uniref:DMT family transporter n=1 Tax=Pantoea sp. LMR881 TaxID=3014336 RepID=UPI0022B00CF1|nr:DMT family transporter [Pantoea sp. LMR881]MCZ4057918.1 DMT family transporter [Pantoea sp. LMR881]